MQIPKQKTIRSEKYLEWVKTLECRMTLDCPAGDAHHIKGIGGFSGGALKAPDYLSMPLTRGAHTTMHDNPDLWPEQYEMIVRTIHRAFVDGVIDFTDEYK